MMTKKICCVIPSLMFGGMERVMSTLANYFADEKSQEVYIVLFGIKREVEYPISDRITVVKPNFEFNNAKRTLCTVKTMFWLRRTIKHINPDTVLSFGEYWNNLVLLSLLGTKYHVYISDRSKPDLKIGTFQDFLRKKLYPKSTGIICQTEKAYSIMKNKLKHENLRIIGNPIRNIKSKPYEERQNVVLSVGRLIDTKNFDRMISIFSKVYKPGWKLVIVGGDALKQKNLAKLQAQIDCLGMTDKILLEGYKTNVEDYLSNSKIFAFTSSSEGFPNVIGEAMSAGLPVVSYDCVAGPSDMIEDGKNGYLVPLFDDNKFIEKLSYLMTNEKELIEMSDYSKKSIRRFDKDVICQKFYDFITGGK